MLPARVGLIRALDGLPVHERGKPSLKLASFFTGTGSRLLEDGMTAAATVIGGSLV
jgi:hypothetical protein